MYADTETYKEYDTYTKILVNELTFNLINATEYLCLICGDPLQPKEIKYVIDGDKEMICSECEITFP